MTAIILKSLLICLIITFPIATLSTYLELDDVGHLVLSFIVGIAIGRIYTGPAIEALKDKNDKS